MCVFSQTNPYYVKPRVADHQFGIKHYAGEVMTDENGCLWRVLCLSVWRQTPWLALGLSDRWGTGGRGGAWILSVHPVLLPPYSC